MTTPSPRQESHRIYWQQWSATPDPSQDEGQKSELVTGSAAIRISDEARSADVTALLRQTLNLPGTADTAPTAKDVLVLVGTLHSLPKTYLRFEHDQLEASRPRESEALHVVRTLQPDENPLVVRDAVLEHLRERLGTPTQRTVIAPRLQWFFVPFSLQAPGCIELDGYCTDMEPAFADPDEESDDERDTGIDGDDGVLAIELEDSISYPWMKEEGTADKERSGDGQRSIHPQEDDSEDMVYRILSRERRRYQLLSGSHSVVHRQYISGYLLKRSPKDHQLWRRVFCILTDDHLWCVSRLYTIGAQHHRVANHQRVSLKRALLLESTPDYTPLQRLLFSFELVSGSGVSHVFRASNRRLQLRWIQCLGERILQNHENSGLEHAELIVEDEALARNRRIRNVAVKPIMEQYKTATDYSEESAIVAVLRWGLDVADYRERCRHILARMPNIKPVVVAEGTNPTAPTPRKLFDSLASNGLNGGENHSSGRLDADTRAMLRAAWDAAAVTLRKAMQLAMDQSFVDANKKKKKRTMASNLEGLCHHVDYVITGRFRQLSEASDEDSERVERNHESDSPPIDLFDSLLAELQSNAGIAQDARANGNV